MPFSWSLDGGGSLRILVYVDKGKGYIFLIYCINEHLFFVQGGNIFFNSRRVECQFFINCSDFLDAQGNKGLASQ